MAHTIYLQSVDSREATPEELEAAEIRPEQIPIRAGRPMCIMAHQAETIQALRFGHAPVVINAAMTGDGKTLAGRFQLFSDDSWKTLAMYPTNELANDQQRSLSELLRDWSPLPAPWRNTPPNSQVINAARLDQIQAELEAGNALSRSSVLELLLNSDYVMTNPDIFHLIMNFRYHQYGTARDTLIGLTGRQYRLFVFDEFHLFGIAQTASVMMALLLLKLSTQEKEPPRFLFLSATVQGALADMARDAGIETVTIHGRYQHGSPYAPAGWRRILQRAALHLYTGKLEDWIQEHSEDVILAFFRQHRPGAKGVIIANSVATAHRVYQLLKPICDATAIRVEANTALVPASKRHYNFDLLVATSTVDVGVDFKINLLIFESTDAATHMQRLGRLGRHVTNVDGQEFGHFEAHALLPSWVYEGITGERSDGSEVSRYDYQKSMEQYFKPLQQFERYRSTWAGIQASQIIVHLSQPEIKKQYSHIVPILKQHYKTLFRMNLNRFKEIVDAGQKALLDAATTFRGSSPFTVLVVDRQAEEKTVVPYNLMPLLFRGELQAVDLPDMYVRARRYGQNPQRLEQTGPLAAYEILGWLPKARDVRFYLDVELSPSHCDTVIEQHGFSIHMIAPAGMELMRLNDSIASLTLVALLIPNKLPDELRRLLKLGIQPELYHFQTLNNVTGSVAFGRDALLINSIWHPKKTDEPLIF